MDGHGAISRCACDDCSCENRYIMQLLDYEFSRATRAGRQSDVCRVVVLNVDEIRDLRQLVGSKDWLVECS